jgi:DNA-binding CsgD family transcriptional regulator/outer membrane protein assembly factor BamB
MSRKFEKEMALCKAGLILLLLGGLCGTVSSQGLGTPFTLNYRKAAYRGGTQTWDIAQGPDGVMYFANNDGLLEFDSYEWRQAPVSNQTILRSLALGNDGRIYAGAQDELGYFAPDERGVLRYHSLKPSYSADPLRFEDIWNIELVGAAVYFRAMDRIFFLSADSLQLIRPPAELTFMGQADGRLFTHVEGVGLMELKGKELQFLAAVPPGAGPLSGILPLSRDTILFTSLKGGILALAGGQLSPWRTSADDFLRLNRIYTAAVLPQERLALGTSRGGILILDAQRRPLAHLHIGNGLQNNNILKLFADQQGNLWAATDNGIDCVLANSPFSFLTPDGELEGTAYAALVAEGSIYLGTSNGVYRADWAQRSALEGMGFSLVDNTQGQAWGLAALDGTVLLGHHDGPLLLEGGRARLLADYRGAWTFLPLEGHPDHMVGGGYYGLYLFKKSGLGWRLLRKIEGLEESCRILAAGGHGVVWVAHPYRGVFRVALNQDLEVTQLDFFTQADGLPSDNFNHVFKINKEVVFGTAQGVYRFDEQAGRFERHPAYEAFFPPGQRVQQLVEGPDGHVWFAAGEEVGLLEVEDAGLRKAVSKRLLPPLAGRLVGGFELIYPYDEDHVLFGTERGFILYDRRASLPDAPRSRVLIRQVQVREEEDSLVFVERYLPGHEPARASTRFGHRHNAFRFAFALPEFGEAPYVRYSYQLEGLETSWSPWTEKTEREYTNLPPGNYAFRVKALRQDGSESEPAEYRFEIAPPWYASPTAFLVYALLALAGLLALVLLPQRRFRREREYLQTEHRKREEAHLQQQEAALQELARLKNEKLQAEINYKNKELASATLHLLQKGEILARIGDELHKIAKQSAEAETRKSLQSLVRILEQDTRLDEDWEQFAQHFDQVHSDFLKRLREQYPQLTPKDQRLCAYLRMNLSSKEAAQLLNISVRGVEVSRYRLRKKMGLSSDDNLTEVLMGI